ncbi:hypothetical protein [uncultured Xanthomonas sp.]|uniref:hypothetical protein n=1 Tax=uncultured Xanthomonas sp. TaxID=152831 RepID=UPI0025FE2CE3|nr:hypothetical protein [uncultured Xanthomonas sp.]
MAGIAGFLAVRDGIPWWFSRHDGALSQAIAQHAGAAFHPFFKAHRYRWLLNTSNPLGTLAADG